MTALLLPDIPLPSTMTMLRIASGVLASLLLVVLTALSVCTVVRCRRIRQRAAIESHWHAAVRQRSIANSPIELATGLSRLSARHRVTAIAGLVGSLSNNMVAAVTDSAELTELRRRGDRWTHSRLWWRRLRGVRTLAQLREPPRKYRRMLTDTHPEVRAEVAGWVAQEPHRSDIERLITMLDKDVRRCRFAAENALRTIGVAAVPALTKYLRGPARHAAVAMDIASAAGLPELNLVATSWSDDSDPVNRAASAALVAAIGTDQAGGVLLGLLEDPGPQVRAAAANGLGTIALWSAAPQLTQHLHDPDWSVRRAAAGALRELGPVGRLCLRRAVDDPDGRAAEMAEHVLDLPQSALNPRAR